MTIKMPRPHPVDTVLLLLIVVCTLFLNACSTVPADAPKTPQEAIAQGYVAVDALATAVRIAKRDGHISAERRDQITGQLEIALSTLEAADDLLRAKDPASDDAMARVIQAQAILRAVETTLKELQK